MPARPVRTAAGVLFFVARDERSSATQIPSHNHRSNPMENDPSLFGAWEIFGRLIDRSERQVYHLARRQLIPCGRSARSGSSAERACCVIPTSGPAKMTRPLHDQPR